MYRPLSNYNKHNDLIKRLLLEHCPELDLSGLERILLVECKNDVSLYVMYLLDNHLVTDKTFIDYFSMFVLNYDIGLDDVVKQILTIDQEHQFDIDCEKYGRLLVNEWWNKFQIRTQVKLNKSKEEEKAMDIMNGVRPIFTPEEMVDLTYYIANILLKNGERVFLRMMINNLINGTIATRVNRNKTNFTPQDKLQLTQLIGFEAKRMTEKSGPLIFMFMDKHYYNTKMKEWRGGDLHGQIF